MSRNSDVFYERTLAPGSGEASNDSQHQRALLYWTALQADPESANYADALSAAIMLLQRKQAYMHNPAGGRDDAFAVTLAFLKRNDPVANS